MSSSNPNATKIKKVSPPPKSNGEEGNIAVDKNYFYLYSNGRWIKIAINTYTR